LGCRLKEVISWAVSSFSTGAVGMGNGYGSFGNSCTGSYPGYNGNYGNAYAYVPFNDLPNLGTAFELPDVLSFGLG
jgi:hypothetical protein